MTLRWTTWGGGPVPAGPVPDHLVALAQRCRRADGGMPLADDPAFLRRRWAAPGGVRFGLRAPDGSLLAAGTTCPVPDGGVIVTGLVDPAARGRGLGAEVLDRCLTLAAGDATNTAGSVLAIERAAATARSATGAAEPAAMTTASTAPTPEPAATTAEFATVARAPGRLPGEVATAERESVTVSYD